jgi:hypothetical protein
MEHGWVFGREGIRPANTLITGCGIIGEDIKVEIEVEAVVCRGTSHGEVLRLK